MIQRKSTNTSGAMAVRLLVGFLLILGMAPAASSHPVSYKGSTGLMTWNQSFMSETWITYSFKPDMAIAARLMRMEMP